MTKIILSISGSNLDKMDVIGSSDPFVVGCIDGKTEVLKTNVIKNNINPDWENVCLDFDKLNNDRDKMITFSVYDWDRGSKNDLIGTFKASVNDIVGKKTFDIINTEKKQKKGSKYVNSGVITFNKIEFN
ncbi:hypothetical protein PIROE2DRAFT_19503 [Piromyces sp. E2]|nr:hypothetical protein PIROE2DRAFT_19503 [Piromyces sp. E2]|eukprot:OUM70400.1 hypothetical protein PIROE2DRAFT_19503 [Piromyces sp. E2]